MKGQRSGICGIRAAHAVSYRTEQKSVLSLPAPIMSPQKTVPASSTPHRLSVKTTISAGRKYDLPVLQPVDERGKYTETPWKGRFVMEDGLDVDIIKWLAGRIKSLQKRRSEHNYPHCWRCGTPLVYYAKPSWYIEMTKLKDQLVANNNTVNWHPGFCRREAASATGSQMSRTGRFPVIRYWGTPDS